MKTYLHKKRDVIRKKHSVDTASNHSIQITNATRSQIQKLEICGSTRQKYSSTAISPDNPLELLTADSFNLITNNMKNELTDEYMAKFWDATQWGEGDWSRTNYKKSPVLQLKPNTTYTFYKSTGTSSQLGKNYNLNYPRNNATSNYTGFKYQYDSTSQFYNEYGCNKWTCHPTDTNIGSNRKHFTFITDSSGEVWFSKISGTSQSTLTGLKNSYELNGMIIVEGSYTQEEMEANIINIPSSITLDDGTEVKLELGHVYDSANVPVIWDSIEVKDGKVTYNKRTYEYAFNGMNDRSIYGYGNVNSYNSTTTQLRAYPGWIKNISTVSKLGAKTNSSTIQYKPTCNVLMGFYNTQNTKNRVYCGNNGNYAGWITFVVDKSIIDSYNGNYIGIIYNDEIMSLDSICYFKINQILYKFTAPHELTECTSFIFNTTDNLLYIDGVSVEYEIAGESDEIVNYVRFHNTNDKFYNYPNTNSSSGSRFTKELSSGSVCYFKIYAGSAGSTSYTYKFTAPIDFNKYTDIYFDYANLTLYVEGVAVTVENVTTTDSSWINLGSFKGSDRLKSQQYFKDQRATGKTVVVRYPVETITTTDITNSDLGRQLLALKLNRNNVISTDNPYAYDNIKITYKKYGG